jgi:glutathione S-transferase
MADYTLHCFVQSGNAYKAALMLALTRSDWEAVWVDFFNGQTRTPEFRAINPMGEVPVLVDNRQGGIVLTQSGNMLYHLAGVTGMFKPEGAAEEREVLRWILWDNHKLTSYTATYRFLRMFAGKEGSPEAEFLKGRMLSAFKVLEGWMASRDFVASHRPTIADISMCGYLFWPSDFGVDWKDYPAIAAWLDRIRSLENWAEPQALLPAGPASA